MQQGPDGPHDPPASVNPGCRTISIAREKNGSRWRPTVLQLISVRPAGRHRLPPPRNPHRRFPPSSARRSARPSEELLCGLASGVPDRGGPRSPGRGGFKAGIHGPTSSSSNPAHSSREMGIPPVIHGGRPGPVRRGSHTRENHGTTPARLSHRTPKVVFYRRRQHPPLALVGWSDERGEGLTR